MEDLGLAFGIVLMFCATIAIAVFGAIAFSDNQTKRDCDKRQTLIIKDEVYECKLRTAPQ